MSIFIALQFQNFFFGKTLPSHIVPPEAPALQFYHRLYKFCNVGSSNLFVCTLTCPLFGGLDFSLSTLRVLDFCRVHFQGYILLWSIILWTIPIHPGRFIVIVQSRCISFFCPATFHAYLSSWNEKRPAGIDPKPVISLHSVV